MLQQQHLQRQEPTLGTNTKADLFVELRSCSSAIAPTAQQELVRAMYSQVANLYPARCSLGATLHTWHDDIVATESPAVRLEMMHDAVDVEASLLMISDLANGFVSFGNSKRAFGSQNSILA
eukprot:939689-Amphidinium_carterae.1